MNSNFKDSFNKILADADLKDRLNKAVTVEEVYNVFKSAGYSESSEKLEGEIRDVIRNFVKSKGASDEDLSQVAGGRGPGAIKKMSAAALALMGVASAAATSTHAAPGGFESVKATANKYWKNPKVRSAITHTGTGVVGLGIGAAVVGAGWLLFGGKGGVTPHGQVNGFENLKNIDIALDQACNMIRDIMGKQKLLATATTAPAAAGDKAKEGAKTTAEGNLKSALGEAKNKILELVDTMHKQGLLVRSFNKDEFVKGLKEKYGSADEVANGLGDLFAKLNLSDRICGAVSKDTDAIGFIDWATEVHIMIQSKLQKEFKVGENGVSLEDFINYKGIEAVVPTTIGNKLFRDMQGGEGKQANKALFSGVVDAIEKADENKIDSKAYTAFVAELKSLNAFNQSFLDNTDDDHVNGMLDWLVAALKDNNNEGAGALLALLSNRSATDGTELKGEASKSEHVKTIKGLSSISSQNLKAVKEAVGEFATATKYFRDSEDKVPPMLKKFADQIDNLNKALTDNNLIKYLEAASGTDGDEARKGALQALLTAELNGVMAGLTLEAAQGKDAAPAIGTTDIKNVNELLQAIDAAAKKVEDDAIKTADETKKAATDAANKQQDEQKNEALKAAEEGFNRAKADAEAAHKKVADATAKVEALVKSLNSSNVSLSDLGVDTAAISAIIK